MQLHEKFNELRDSLWADLMHMQQRQIEMSERLVAENLALKPYSDFQMGATMECDDLS